jgi:hypothetical protein
MMQIKGKKLGFNSQMLCDNVYFGIEEMIIDYSINKV